MSYIKEDHEGERKGEGDDSVTNRGKSGAKPADMFADDQEERKASLPSYASPRP